MIESLYILCSNLTVSFSMTSLFSLFLFPAMQILCMQLTGKKLYEMNDVRALILTVATLGTGTALLIATGVLGLMSALS